MRCGAGFGNASSPEACCLQSDSCWPSRRCQFGRRAALRAERGRVGECQPGLHNSALLRPLRPALSVRASCAPAVVDGLAGSRVDSGIVRDRKVGHRRLSSARKHWRRVWSRSIDRVMLVWSYYSAVVFFFSPNWCRPGLSTTTGRCDAYVSYRTGLTPTSTKPGNPFV